MLGDRPAREEKKVVDLRMDSGKDSLPGCDVSVGGCSGNRKPILQKAVEPGKLGDGLNSGVNSRDGNGRRRAWKKRRTWNIQLPVDCPAIKMKRYAPLASE